MTTEEIQALKDTKTGQDTFSHPDFYGIDDLLTDEQKLVRDSVTALSSAVDMPVSNRSMTEMCLIGISVNRNCRAI